MDSIKNDPDAETMAKRLLGIALRSPKCQDNVSIIVVVLN